MNEYQTAQFAVGASLVGACLILGLIITELVRKLAKERETVERLRQLNSKNYHHRKTMERAITSYKASLKDPSFYELLNAGKASKEDHD